MTLETLLHARAFHPQRGVRVRFALVRLAELAANKSLKDFHAKP